MLNGISHYRNELEDILRREKIRFLVTLTGVFKEN